jgi:predicted GIY-YIG superfamily endonuclease
MYSVYLIQSIIKPKQHYVGLTNDLKRRINAHNSGHSIHTNKYKPWKLIVYLGFNQQQTANNFEAYLKTGSGRAFLTKHFF